MNRRNNVDVSVLPYGTITFSFRTGSTCTSNTAVSALPIGEEALAGAVTDASGGLVGVPGVWLNVAAANVPGDPYIATGLFGIAAAAVAVGAG